MGSPKALLDFRGETFLARLLRIFGTVCDPLIVVLGHHVETLRAHVPPHVRVVVNPDPDRGQLSSLQIALAALPEECTGFLFTLVDSPAVSETTVARIVETFERSDAPLVIPKVNGKRGHPVCAARSLAQEFLALDPTDETRRVINAHSSEILYLELDDPGVLADADDPAAYARLLEQTR
jgi:molybdenum cofactor cytidylyltransferase